MTYLKTILIVSVIIILGVVAYLSISQTTKDSFENEYSQINDNNNNNNNEKSQEMVLILSAPSVHNEYYIDYFEDIVDFQVGYAQKVIEHNTDIIRILVDHDTKEYYEGRVPDEVLIVEEMYDIWMRDFTTVDPHNPIQFVYTDASMTKKESKLTQQRFSEFADDYDIKRQKTSLQIDGGNIVDDYAGRFITTTRFLTDNNIDYNEAKKILKQTLQANEIAIIEPDDDVLAHSDGMVAWIDDNVLAINDYSEMDPEYHTSLIEELQTSFPDVQIITIPVEFDNKPGVDNTKGIGSACGININLVATPTTLYVPVFGTESEKEVLKIIAQHTSKDIVEINAKGICRFGGSVRCTTWQLSSENAKHLIENKEK